MTTLTIDRSKWARGKNNGLSALLNDDGNMCCLGFAAIQITGLTPDDIQGFGQYEELLAHREFLLENGGPFVEGFDSEEDYDEQLIDTKFHNRAVAINDFEISSTAVNFGNYDAFVKDEADREAQLVTLFKKDAGIDVEFIN